MNIVETFEKAIIIDMQNITNYSGINWKKVFLNGGDIDFHDKEVDITFWVGDYGDKYKFWYDYEMKRGGLFKVEVKNNEEDFITLWSKGLTE